MTTLHVLSVGAVTPAGLSAAQTCAALRARLSAISEAVTIIPEAEVRLGARIPARSRLREPVERWLAALAERALRDALTAVHADCGRIALLIALPEAFRAHPAFEDRGPIDLLRRIERRFGARFHPASRVLASGHAAAFEGLSIARQLIAERSIAACLVGGVDSLLNRIDVGRLQSSGRLHEPGNPQGVIPGEGAAFVLVAGHAGQGRTLATVLGIALDSEPDTALGDRYSTGRALERALRRAVTDGGCKESDLSLRVSDMNGERYKAWESFIAGTRFYRTRRKCIPAWFPASCVGDTGAAAGALSLVAAAIGLSRGYAPGRLAMCEGSSEQGLRGACILAPAPGAAQPPFRSRASGAELQ